MMNKRGQGMSTNTIVLLIIAVIVLVVLILGFTIGWKKITPWISPVNVKDVVGACSAACATGGTYDFCSVNRELMDADKKKFTTTCAIFSTEGLGFDKYGIDDCSLDCRALCAELSVNGKTGIVPTTKPIEPYYNVSVLAEDSDNCVILK